MNISTHALTEGDFHFFFLTDNFSHFNSRPHGGRLSIQENEYDEDDISTHALTEGDDKSMSF